MGDHDQNTNNGFTKKIGLVIGLLILLAAIGGGLWYWNELRVTVGTDDAQVTGNIADISPKIAGRLEQLYVTEGEAVSAGQKLAQLDNAALAVAMSKDEAALKITEINYSKLPDDLKSAQAGADKAQQGLLAAQSQEQEAEFALGDAKRNLDETQTLFSSGSASKEAMDAATSRYGEAQAALDAAKASVQSAQSNLQDAQAQLDAINNTDADSYLAQVKQAQAAYDSDKLNYDESFMYAPTGGTVVRVPGVIGEYVSPGQAILSISDLQTSWVVAYVEETDYGRIRLGQKVDVWVDAYPGKVFHGSVIELGGVTQNTFSLIPTENDTGNFTKIIQRLPVKIDVDQATLLQAGLLLRPGMSVEVRIHTV